MITFTISLLAHNECELTRQCLQSLLPSLTDEVQLILVDNASTDSTPAVFAEFRNEHPEITIGILNMGSNAGFIAAHNHACSFALGSYFVVLNNDIFFRESGWLDRIQQTFLDDPKTAIVGASGNCNALHPNGKGFLMDCDPEYVEGSILAIRTSLAKQYGLFSMEYRFGYCEDADLSLRVRERGWNVRTIAILHDHYRFKTYEHTKTEIDLEGFDALNHMKFGQRWAVYLKQRNFKYRIAVKRSGARGDVLLVTPVLRALKQRFGDAEIDVCTDHPEMLYRNPSVRSVLTGSSGKTCFEESSEYDVRFNLDNVYEVEPKKHIVQAYADKCGIECANWQPEIYPSDKDRLMACGMVNGNSKRPLAVFHVGPTAWAGRNWPVANFIEVARHVMRCGWEVVAVGNPQTFEIPATYDLRGKTTVHELAAVIERAGVFIGLDSLPMHLAACSMVPTVALFGCVDPKLRLMPWPYVKGVQAENVSCLGCHHEHLGPKFWCDCLRPRVECMEKLQVDQVTAAILEVFKEKLVQLETTKIRARVMPFIKGNVIDLGCSRDPIEPDCMTVDKNPWPEVKKVLDIAGPLPWEDGFFDTVYSSHALEDQDDPAGVLREWSRILKSGGNLILYVPHKTLYPATGMVNYDHKVPGFLPEELEEMLQPIGYKTLINEVDSGVDRYSVLYVGEKA